MARQRNEKRNEELVKRHKAGWSFRELGKIYSITVRAAWEIFQRDQNLYHLSEDERKVYSSIIAEKQNLRTKIAAENISRKLEIAKKKFDSQVLQLNKELERKRIQYEKVKTALSTGARLTGC